MLFSLDLYLLKENRFRFRFNELNPIKKRYEVEDVIIDNLEQDKLEIVKQTSNVIELKSNQNKNRVILYSDPLKVEFYIDQYLVISLNSNQFLKFEHLRLKE